MKQDSYFSKSPNDELCFHNPFSERMRLNNLQQLIETEFDDEFKDIAHPHNAYNLIKHWNNAVDLTKDGASTDEMLSLLETNGITLPTAIDITGNVSLL